MHRIAELAQRVSRLPGVKRARAGMVQSMLMGMGEAMQHVQEGGGGRCRGAVRILC